MSTTKVCLSDLSDAKYSNIYKYIYRMKFSIYALHVCLVWTSVSPGHNSFLHTDTRCVWCVFMLRLLLLLLLVSACALSAAAAEVAPRRIFWRVNLPQSLKYGWSLSRLVCDWRRCECWIVWWWWCVCVISRRASNAVWIFITITHCPPFLNAFACALFGALVLGYNTQSIDIYVMNRKTPNRTH